MNQSMETKEEKKITTFYDIISEYKIEIPVIQRDYAQGRISKRVTPIRESFIEDIIEAIGNSDRQNLHLNFVYGRIEGKNQKLIYKKNKDAIENILIAIQGYANQLNVEFDPQIKFSDLNNSDYIEKFIPLDGQQRLTTLFLLHLYLVMRIPFQENDKKNYLCNLSGFTYKTRKTTEEFCDFLIMNNPHNFIKEIPASKILEENIRFIKKWKKDPSVQGMLTMLDTLHNKLNNKSEEDLLLMWNNLVVNNKVLFDFLDLDEYEQTDELYVKMNARGKQLTDFEHFKSWLQEYAKKLKIELEIPEWSNLIDTKWMNLFWENKDKKDFEVDSSIYNFIKSVNLYEYICKDVDEKKSSDIDITIISRIREVDEDNRFIPISDFQNARFFNKQSLDFLFSSLDVLSIINLDKFNSILSDIVNETFLTKELVDTGLSKFFLSKKLNPSLPDRVFYYSFLIYIFNIQDVNTEESFSKIRKWLRICRNIIFNTYIQNPDDFITAIKAIKELSQYKEDIEQSILNKNLTKGFFGTQLKEEQLKIQYLRKSENWKVSINSIENHQYFQGQTYFIFKMLDDKNDLDQFNKYSKKLSTIFNNLNDDNFLFHRVLLSKGNYLIEKSSCKYSFCESASGSLRVRQDNWRKIFNDEEKLKLLKLVLDEMNDNELKNTTDYYFEKNWRYFFIKDCYIRNLKFLENRIIFFENEWDIRLLEKSTFSGKHADLFSHSLFLDVEKFACYPIIKLEYISVNGKRDSDNYPYIKLTYYENLEFKIFYEPNLKDECGFVIENYNLKPNEIEIYIRNGFILFENIRYYYKINRSQISTGYFSALNCIKNILKELSSI
jgi:hypothetical protein